MTNFASALLVSISCFACAPVANQTAGGDPSFAPEASVGAQPNGAAPRSFATAPGASCESACRHVIDACGLEDDGTCPGQCKQLGLDEATLGRIQRATCEEAAAIIAEVSGQAAEPEPQARAPEPAPQQQGGRVISCWASGVYEVCSNGYCREVPLERFGYGTTRSSAELGALQVCTSHMTNMIVINNINGTGSVRRTCRVTRCN